MKKWNLDFEVAPLAVSLIALMAVGGMVYIAVETYRLGAKMDKERAAHQQFIREYCGKDRLCLWQYGLVRSLREDGE